MNRGMAKVRPNSFMDYLLSSNIQFGYIRSRTSRGNVEHVHMSSVSCSRFEPSWRDLISCTLANVDLIVNSEDCSSYLILLNNYVVCGKPSVGGETIGDRIFIDLGVKHRCVWERRFERLGIPLSTSFKLRIGVAFITLKNRRRLAAELIARSF